jgi:hypothetical protein
MKDNEIQNGDNISISKRNDLVAAIPKDEFKSWFYLLSGKPDSTVKFYQEPIIVSPEDIEDLNNAVQDKLRTHHIEGCVTSISISYQNNSVKEFSTWAEFEHHNWKRPEITDSIHVKWDFMVEMPGFAVPQRHTLMLRIASEIKPTHILQAIFGGGQLNNIENIEQEMSPVYCRVDFINQSLGQELINIVSDWYDGKKKNKRVGRFMSAVIKKKRLFASTAHYSIPLLSGVLACALLFYRCHLGDQNNPLTVGASKWLFLWLLITSFSIILLERIGQKVASSIYKSLSGYDSCHYFNFTNGDDVRQSEMTEKTQKKAQKLWAQIILTIAYDIGLAFIISKLIK